MTRTAPDAAANGPGDRETLVVKLGGSVVTEKESPETVDEAALAEAAAAIAAADANLVVVHGGGSFGHHHAAEHGVSTTEGTQDDAGVRAIHGAMTRLNDRVVAALADRDVRAVPVRPLSMARRDAEGTLSLATGAVSGLLGEGFVPVIHGDVIAHAGEGVTVLSGDELVAALAPAVGADRVGLCSTVPGVLDESGAVVEHVTALSDVDALGASDATDVTGGMAGKVATLLDLEVPAQVFGPDALAAFLSGDAPGTTVG